MYNRIIDLSEHPADLSIKHEQLVIRSNGQEAMVPLEDIGAVIVSHPAIRLTLAVIAELSGRNAGFIVCDQKHMPSGMMLPMAANFLQTERMTAQSDMTEPAKKGLWQTVIKAKIRSQAGLLQKMTESDGGLGPLAKKVKSGDPDNLEARASRIYWPRLFGDDFRRIPQGGGNLNGFLNYGYAIVRGMTARAICASGLNPTLGLHHHNRYNPFCLADDLMEPFRPIVDAVAAECIRDGLESRLTLDRAGKQALISAIIGFRCHDAKQEVDLFTALARLAGRLVDVILGKRKDITIPAPFP